MPSKFVKRLKLKTRLVHLFFFSQYIGEIDNIPTTADMSNRNYLLAKLDDRRNSGKLPWGLGMENNVTVTLSAYNVKIIKDDRTGVSDKLTKPNSQCEIKLAALCLEHFAPHSNPRDCGSQLCQG